MDAQLTLLVLSCDKFYDTWEPLNYSLSKYWNAKKIPIHLLTNHKLPNYNNINVINVGDDVSWSQNLIYCLKNVSQEYVLLWLDDVFITSKVDTDRIIEDFNWVVQNEISYLRLRRTDQKKARPNYFKISNDSMYRTSIFCSIWKKDVLESLLEPEENAWQFELRGSKRSIMYEKFYQVAEDRISYLHAIEKGIWNLKAIRWMKKNKLNYDLDYRKAMSVIEYLNYVLNSFKVYFINHLSPKNKKLILAVSRKFYIKIGLRKENYYDNF